MALNRFSYVAAHGFGWIGWGGVVGLVDVRGYGRNM